MSNLILYVDGGQSSKDNVYRQSWGIHALHNQKTVEFGGSITTSEKCGGFHEMLAFYHGIKYATEQGFEPENTVIYSDDIWFSEAGFVLHRGNRAPSAARHKLIKRITRFVDHFYPEDKSAKMLIVKWLYNSRIHWVKGHATELGNRRADYLARKYSAGKKPQPYMAWFTDQVIHLSHKFWACTHINFARTTHAA